MSRLGRAGSALPILLGLVLAIAALGLVAWVLLRGTARVDEVRALPLDASLVAGSGPAPRVVLPEVVPVRGAEPAPDRLVDFAGTGNGEVVEPPPASESAAAVPAVAEPAAPAAPARTGALRIRVRWGSDGTPAADVGIALEELPRRGGPLELAGRTDASGVLLLPEVKTGVPWLRVDRNSSVSTASMVSEPARSRSSCSLLSAGFVRAGATAEIELVIPPGVWVRGVVVDGAGQPVGGASILVSASHEKTGLVAGVADHDGRFEVRDVGRSERVGASAPGFAASPLQDLDDARTERGGSRLEAELTLQLGALGVTLRGRVIARSGEPVAGAVVTAGDATSWRDGPPPVITRSDAEGRFEAADVAADRIALGGRLLGSVPVAVTAAGFAHWSDIVRFEPGSPEEVEIVLRPAGVVAGVVRDGEGRPVAGASVASSDATPVSARSDEDGRYELAGVQPGRPALHASLEGLGEARVSLDVEAGGRSEWNPVLDAGLVLRGRVMRPSGAPVVGASVDVRAGREDGAGFRRTTTTGEDGRFVLTNIVRAELTLEVRVRTAAREWGTRELPSFVLRGVRAGGEERLVTLPESADPSAFVRLRVEDGKGRPARDVRVAIERVEAAEDAGSGLAGAERTRDLHVDSETLGWRGGPFPPGTYRLAVHAANGFPAQRTESFVLRAEAEHDAGVVVLPGDDQLGDLLVRGRGNGGLQLRQGGERVAEALTGWLGGRLAAESIEIHEDGGWSWRSRRLPAGEYLLVVSWMDDTPEDVLPVSLVAGETTVIDVVPRPGVRCELSVERYGHPNFGPEVRLRLTNEHGAVSFRHAGARLAMLRDAAEPLWRGSLEAELRPGSYRLEIRVDGDLVRTDDIEVPDGAGEVVRWRYRLE